MKVGIIFGSKSDVDVMKGAADCLKKFGIEYSAHILSAHRVPELLEETLEKFGAVSEEVAREMALGVAKRLNSDFAIATTGIAGPNSDESGKPVGLVYIAVYAQGDVTVKECLFVGDRELIRYRASVEALDEVRKNILKKL
mgnify:CR=1 FL=1